MSKLCSQTSTTKHKDDADEEEEVKEKGKIKIAPRGYRKIDSIVWQVMPITNSSTPLNVSRETMKSFKCANAWNIHFNSSLTHVTSTLKSPILNYPTAFDSSVCFVCFFFIFRVLYSIKKMHLLLSAGKDNWTFTFDPYSHRWCECESAKKCLAAEKKNSSTIENGIRIIFMIYHFVFRLT